MKKKLTVLMMILKNLKVLTQPHLDGMGDMGVMGVMDEVRASFKLFDGYVLEEIAKFFKIFVQ